jgi:hypothetical protein
MEDYDTNYIDQERYTRNHNVFVSDPLLHLDPDLPEHWPKDCTSAPDSDYHGGQYDLDGYDDGNLNGEC